MVRLSRRTRPAGAVPLRTECDTGLIAVSAATLYASRSPPRCSPSTTLPSYSLMKSPVPASGPLDVVRVELLLADLRRVGERVQTAVQVVVGRARGVVELVGELRDVVGLVGHPVTQRLQLRLVGHGRLVGGPRWAEQEPGVGVVGDQHRRVHRTQPLAEAVGLGLRERAGAVVRQVVEVARRARAAPQDPVVAVQVDAAVVFVVALGGSCAPGTGSRATGSCRPAACGSSCACRSRCRCLGRPRRRPSPAGPRSCRRA